MKGGQRLRRTRKRRPPQQQETNARLPLNLQELELGLKQAMLEMQTNSRAGTLTAVRTVINFIASIPEFRKQNLTTPMLILLMALHDLDAGLVVTMLKRDSNPCPRRQEATIRKLVKSYVAAYVDTLCQFVSVREASTLMARELKRIGFDIGGRVETAAWKTVKVWRDGITKLPADDQTRLIIKGLRENYVADDFASPAAAKAAVVAGFRKTISVFGRAALE
jgi:hypothetical protein